MSLIAYMSGKLKEAKGNDTSFKLYLVIPLKAPLINNIKRTD